MESRLASSIGSTGGGVVCLTQTCGSGCLDTFAVIDIALEVPPAFRAAGAGKAGDATDGTCSVFFSSDCHDTTSARTDATLIPSCLK